MQAVDWEVLALAEAARQAWGYTALFAGTLKQLVFREITVKESLRGPLGIAQMAVQETRKGVAHFLWFLAFLSINLGAVNLVPIPLLDGGHALLLAIEAARRKPLSLKAQLVAQQVGLALLLFVVMYTTLHDLLRLF